MPAPSLPQNLTLDDYALIEGAVMETVRGRWFLMEFARRSRAAELSQIRDAIQRLERTLAQAPAPLPAATLERPSADIVAFVPRSAPSPLNQALEALSRFDNLATEEKLALFG